MKAIKQALLIAIGWLSVTLGVIGIFLPVLPTTPFMLLAAACFAKSSPRFHKWLLANKVFGPLIINWQQERYIEKRTKVRALLVVALTFSLSIYVVPVLYVKYGLVVCWLTCTFFIARLSTVPASKR